MRGISVAINHWFADPVGSSSFLRAQEFTRYTIPNQDCVDTFHSTKPNGLGAVVEEDYYAVQVLSFLLQLLYLRPDFRRAPPL